MSLHSLKRTRHITAGISAILASVLFASVVWAHGGPHSSAPVEGARASARGEMTNYRPPDDLKLDAQELTPMYGGQVIATKWHFFEVVYQPREIRIYVYSPSRRPMDAERLKGKVLTLTKGTSKPVRYKVKQATDTKGRSYGAVAIDFGRVRDGEMKVKFELTRLPFKEERKAEFVQTFYLTRPPVPVIVARLTSDDKRLVEQQRICPVMDAELTAHGDPIKLIVGNNPIFVCCESCIEAIRKKPQHYLDKTAYCANRKPKQKVSIFRAIQDDDAAIVAQRICPVTGNPLGRNSRTIKVVINGRSKFVCCNDCIDRVVQKRDAYSRDNGGARASQLDTRRTVETRQPRRNITVNYAAKSDLPAIQVQRNCPVMNEPLGSHGRPIKILVDGQPLFVCCRGCVNRVQKNPSLYLSKVGNRSSVRRAKIGTDTIRTSDRRQVIQSRKQSGENNVR